MADSERMLVSALLPDGGLYDKEQSVRIEETMGTCSEYSARASRSGTVLELCIRIEPGSSAVPAIRIRGSECYAPPSLPAVSFRGSASSFQVDAVVLSDTGLVNDIIFHCVSDAFDKLWVPDLARVFEDARQADTDIHRPCAAQSPVFSCRSYGVLQDTPIRDAILQEKKVCDSAVQILTQGDTVFAVQIEKDGLRPHILSSLLQGQVENANKSII